MRSMCFSACIVGVVLISAAVAQANLTGQTIQTTYLYPDTSASVDGPTNSVVGAGVELTSFNQFFDVDFSGTNILITDHIGGDNVGAAFNGFRFFDVNGSIASITGVTLNPATSYPSLSAGNITFDANTIFLNVQGIIAISLDAIISLDITFAQATPAAAMPEPLTAGLLPLALAALCIRRRRDVA